MRAEEETHRAKEVQTLLKQDTSVSSLHASNELLRGAKKLESQVKLDINAE